MDNLRIAVVGVGATGAVLAAALLTRTPDVFLVDPNPALPEQLKANGLEISGALSYHVPTKQFYTHIAALQDKKPTVVFISTKTFYLSSVLDELAAVFTPGMKIVSTQNGLGPEDLIADKFGRDAAFRMSLNFGAGVDSPGKIRTEFFNKPNHLGALSDKNRPLGLQLARLLTDSGLDTLYVDDIRLYVWKKMIMKCTMASICAVTGRSIKEALDFPPTREIAEVCFLEALSVAKAAGYDLGEDYLTQAVRYLENVGAHKDSMCQDIAEKSPTEIDFLGAKIVAYGRSRGIPTPCFVTMTNLVKALENSYSGRGKN